jgi:hypothetical protein
VAARHRQQIRAGRKGARQAHDDLGGRRTLHRHRQQIERDDQLVGVAPAVPRKVAPCDDQHVVRVVDDRARNEQRRARRVVVIIVSADARREERHDKKRNQQSLHAVHGGSSHRLAVN